MPRDDSHASYATQYALIGEGATYDEPPKCPARMECPRRALLRHAAGAVAVESTIGHRHLARECRKVRRRADARNGRARYFARFHYFATQLEPIAPG